MCTCMYYMYKYAIFFTKYILNLYTKFTDFGQHRKTRCADLAPWPWWQWWFSGCPLPPAFVKDEEVPMSAKFMDAATQCNQKRPAFRSKCKFYMCVCLLCQLVLPLSCLCYFATLSCLYIYYRYMYCICNSWNSTGSDSAYRILCPILIPKAWDRG